MAKRSKRKSSYKKKSKKLLNRSPIAYINILIVTTIIILLAFLTNELFLQDSNKDIKVKKIEKRHIKKTDHEKFEEKTKALEIEFVDDLPIVEDEPIVKKQQTFNFDDIENIKTKKYQDDTKNKPVAKIKKVIKQEPSPIKSKPKLAILIDDVTTSWQVKKILDIGYPITMAFLPPNNFHKNSAKIAKLAKIYMIHLPLEANSKKYEEGDTLYVTDSYETIEKRIKEVVSYYPNAKYINNHTGSKFTQNKAAMDKLFRALKKYNLIFVDSKTTSKSVTRKYALKYNVPYLSRNIFLDNKQDKTYIQNQLKKAIKFAIKKGQAIAIGHPHKITLKTLKDSKNLLKSVELVYINQLKL